MNEKTLDKYLKVKALADRGEAGEKANAKQMLKKLQARYPGIERAAEVFRQERDAAQTATRPPPPQQGGRGPLPQWSNIFRQAASFYESVMHVVDEVADAHYGRIVAEEEVEVAGRKGKDALFIRVKIPFSTVNEARVLNPAQKASFRDAVREEVETYLDSILDG